MTLSLHTLPKRHGRRKKRLGRGHGSGRGTTAGRGTKGQRARTGGKGGLQRRAMRDLFLHIPKRRGFTSSVLPYRVVSLAVLDKKFHDGDRIALAELAAIGYSARGCRGIKIVGGSVTKKLHISAHAFTASARSAITTAGGTAALLTGLPSYAS